MLGGILTAADSAANSLDSVHDYGYGYGYHNDNIATGIQTNNKGYNGYSENSLKAIISEIKEEIRFHNSSQRKAKRALNTLSNTLHKSKASRDTESLHIKKIKTEMALSSTIYSEKVGTVFCVLLHVFQDL